MKKYFLVVTTVLAVVAPAGVYAQIDTSNYYLQIVNTLLLRQNNPGVKLFDDATKIEEGKNFCKYLDDGLTAKELEELTFKSLIENQSSETVKKNYIGYKTAIEFAAVHSFCPEHYQQVLGK